MLDSDGVAGFEVASRKVVAGGGGRAGAPLPRLPPCRDVTQQLATLHAIWAVRGASLCDITFVVVQLIALYGVHALWAVCCYAAASCQAPGLLPQMYTFGWG